VPKIVEVPNVGNVEFPDSMSDADVAGAIQKNYHIMKPSAGQADAGQPDAFASIVNGITDFFSGANATGNPLSGQNLQGNANLVAHPVDTPKAMLGSQGDLAIAAKNSFKEGKYLDGVRHAVAYMIPMLGPQIDQAGNKAGNGQIMRGLGEAAGIAVPAALGAKSAIAPEASVIPAKTAPVPAAQVAQDLYRTALRPRVDSTISDVHEMVGTGLNHSLPVSEEGAAKLNGLIQDLSDRIQAKTKAAADAGISVDPAAIAQRVDQLEPSQRLQVNPKRDLAAIEASKQEFLGQHTPPAPRPSGLVDASGNPIEAPVSTGPTPIPADTANLIKQGTYKKIATDYGTMSTAQIESQKALARGIKEELASQIPELNDLNEKQGKLLDLQPVLESAVNRAANSTGSAFKNLLTTGVTHAVTGNAGLSMAAGILQKIMADPATRSRLAIAINQAQQNNPGKWGKPSMAGAIARVARYADALGQTASATAQGNAGEP
jgi:hypothetical protein